MIHSHLPPYRFPQAVQQLAKLLCNHVHTDRQASITVSPKTMYTSRTVKVDSEQANSSSSTFNATDAGFAPTDVLPLLQGNFSAAYPAAAASDPFPALVSATGGRGLQATIANVSSSQVRTPGLKHNPCGSPQSGPHAITEQLTQSSFIELLIQNHCQRLQPYVQEPRRVLCTGYGNGGAYAELCGIWAAVSYPAVYVRTIVFGAPVVSQHCAERLWIRSCCAFHSACLAS